MFISPLAYQYELESHWYDLSTKNFLTSFLVFYGIILRHTIKHSLINPNNASTLQAKLNKKDLYFHEYSCY